MHDCKKFNFCQEVIEGRKFLNFKRDRINLFRIMYAN